jgi:hypothetical protein
MAVHDADDVAIGFDYMSEGRILSLQQADHVTRVPLTVWVLRSDRWYRNMKKW